MKLNDSDLMISLQSLDCRADGFECWSIIWIVLPTLAHEGIAEERSIQKIHQFYNKVELTVSLSSSHTELKNVTIR